MKFPFIYIKLSLQKVLPTTFYKVIQANSHTRCPKITDIFEVLDGSDNSTQSGNYKCHQCLKEEFVF